MGLCCYVVQIKFFLLILKFVKLATARSQTVWQLHFEMLFCQVRRTRKKSPACITGTSRKQITLKMNGQVYVLTAALTLCLTSRGLAPIEKSDQKEHLAKIVLGTVSLIGGIYKVVWTEALEARVYKIALVYLRWKPVAGAHVEFVMSLCRGCNICAFDKIDNANRCSARHLLLLR